MVGTRGGMEPSVEKKTKHGKQSFLSNNRYRKPKEPPAHIHPFVLTLTEVEYVADVSESPLSGPFKTSAAYISTKVYKVNAFQVSSEPFNPRFPQSAIFFSFFMCNYRSGTPTFDAFLLGAAERLRSAVGC